MVKKIFIFGALSLVAWLYFPLEINSARQRFEFWRGGVTDVYEGGLHALVRDACDIDSKKPCTCVALLHGLADDATTWKRLLLSPKDAWAKPVRIYAIDLPGSGRSVPPADPSEYRVRKQAEKLKQFFQTQRMTCPRWVVAGNSLGGWIGAWLALDWQEGVSPLVSLVLVDSAGLKRQAVKAAYFLREPSVEALKDFQKRAYHRPRVIPAHVWSAIARRAKKGNSKDVIRAQVAEDFLDDKLASLRVPTMVFWGDEDQLTPRADGERLKTLIPGAIWRSVPECGHLPQKECPAPLIRALVEMAGL